MAAEIDIGDAMDEKQTLIIESMPKLRSPYVVCGFNGWLNGGDVSVGGIKYLMRHFSAVKFAEIRTPYYHVYQIPGAEGLRPIFKMDEGIIMESHLLTDQFHYALNPASEHDLVLLLGNEPNLNWEEYADTIVTLARDLGAARLYAFGAVLDRSPYTREPRITCTCTSAKVKNEMAKCSVGFSTREGGATFNQMLVYTCQKNGIEGVNLTARAPYYPEFNWAIEYSPRSIKAVLVRLNDLMHLGLDFHDLDDQIRELEGKLDFFKQQNAQFSAYMQELDKNYEETPYQSALDISPSEAVRLAEEFLKRNKDQPQGR